MTPYAVIVSDAAVPAHLVGLLQTRIGSARSPARARRLARECGWRPVGRHCVIWSDQYYAPALLLPAVKVKS